MNLKTVHHKCGTNPCTCPPVEPQPTPNDELTRIALKYAKTMPISAHEALKCDYNRPASDKYLVAAEYIKLAIQEVLKSKEQEIEFEMGASYYTAYCEARQQITQLTAQNERMRRALVERGHDLEDASKLIRDCAFLIANLNQSYKPDPTPEIVLGHKSTLVNLNHFLDKVFPLIVEKHNKALADSPISDDYLLINKERIENLVAAGRPHGTNVAYPDGCECDMCELWDELKCLSETKF